MSKKYHTKGVTFNLSDPDQNELFEHANKRANFSGYVKRLIQRDKDSQSKSEVHENVENRPAEKVGTNDDFDDDLMGGLL